MTTRLTTAITIGLLSSIAAANDKVEWHHGTLDAALERAKADSKRVLIYFWANQSKKCGLMYGQTLQDAECIKRMQDYVCVSADTTSKQGSKLVEKFHIKTVPTVLVLEANGQREDALVGFCPPKNFIEELERIKKGFRTVSYCRKQAEADPKNLELRYKYAELLRHVGDFDGYESVCAAIRKADPSGETLTGAYFKFGDIKKGIREAGTDLEQADLKPLVAFLKKTSHKDVKWEGWGFVGGIELERENRDGARRAFQTAWKHCPETRVLDFGSELSRIYWKMRDQLRSSDKKFILEVGLAQAKRAEELRQPKEGDTGAKYVGKDFDKFLASRLDLLACCYYMAGKRKQAIATIERCIEMKPKAKVFAERLAQFKAGN